MCVRVHRCTINTQLGDAWPGPGGECGECVQVHQYTTSK
jgi:hypothetical protein